MKKSLWMEMGGFAGRNILDVDWTFFRRVKAMGEKIYQMPGVYLFHWYRGGAGDKSHL
jgi:hypothetical protein